MRKRKEKEKGVNREIRRGCYGFYREKKLEGKGAISYIKFSEEIKMFFLVMGDRNENSFRSERSGKGRRGRSDGKVRKWR